MWGDFQGHESPVMPEDPAVLLLVVLGEVVGLVEQTAPCLLYDSVLVEVGNK